MNKRPKEKIGLISLILGIVGSDYSAVVISDDKSGFTIYNYRAPFSSHESKMIAIVFVSGLCLLVGIILLKIISMDSAAKEQMLSSTDDSTNGRTGWLIALILGIAGAVYSAIIISDETTRLFGYRYLDPLSSHEIIMIASAVVSAILIDISSVVLLLNKTETFEENHDDTAK